MIKTILWDFDGVILDSMKIKGDGFVELFREYDTEQVKRLEEYHYKYGGVSRFEKIKHFHVEILKQSVSQEAVGRLADRFSEIIEKKLNNKSNLIEETVEFIENNYTRYNFHIVSGAEHNELNKLCDTLGLSKYFISIDGSPTKKETLIKNIIEKYSYKIDEIVLIGDSVNDYYAANTNKIVFCGYNNFDLKQYGNYIESFKNFIL